MNLLNIYNKKRKVYLFTRDQLGHLEVTTDDSLYPYFYEADATGKYHTYDNRKAKQVLVSEPHEIAKVRSNNSYEADVHHSKRYIIDRIESFNKCPIKALFLDIETLSEDLPDPAEAQDPVTCITVYNTFTKKFSTWYIDQMPGKTLEQKEAALLDGFIHYVREEAPDLLLAWNIDFDYTYLATRVKDFASKISYYGDVRMGDVREIFYPAGISVVDYMTLFKKVYMREQSYALDRVAQKHLGENAWGETTFGEISQRVKEKNINDVRRLVKLEEKYKILEYFDEIRRSATCLWEDLPFNSKVIDMMVLREAKRKGIVLPNKKKYDDETEELQGAYRRSDLGLFGGIYKADVSAMYPSQSINFCLDAQNIRHGAGDNIIEINGNFIYQNKDALIPYVFSQLITKKDALKENLKSKIVGTTEYEEALTKYNAIKALVNSVYGVTALASFRLYDNRIASSITFLARDLLQFAETKMQEIGFTVIYTDTDALMYKSEVDEIDLLNHLAQEWGQKFGKSSINITFESEGYFDTLLLLGKCHYGGYINSNGKRKLEIKGLELKRASSSKFEAEFQKKLLDKILDKEPKESIMLWIAQEQKRMKTLDLCEIGFPSKLQKSYDKNKPIFVRAVENSKILNKNFKVARGELFYYIYIQAPGNNFNVLAFTERQRFDDINIDWDEMFRRSIANKVDAIFEVLGWGSVRAIFSPQLSLF